MQQFPFLSASPPSNFSPPDYPAPALSAQDYGSLGSDLRSLGTELSGSTSSLGNSSTPLQQKKRTVSPSTTPSVARQMVFSKTKDRNTVIDTALNSSFQDSFEDTLQDTADINQDDRWSSFEDLPDECYV